MTPVFFLFDKQLALSSCCHTDFGDTLLSSSGKKPAAGSIQGTQISLGHMRESFPMRAHTLWATLLSSCNKGIVDGRTDSLGACCAAFPTWHIAHAVPRKLGDASLLRIRTVTVCSECLSAVYFLILLSLRHSP